MTGSSDDAAASESAENSTPSESADDDATSDADTGFTPDPARVECLRAIAEDVRGDTSESEQLSNVLYRVSDLYDPDEETTPEEIMRNVKVILDVKERGGLGR